MEANNAPTVAQVEPGDLSLNDVVGILRKRIWLIVVVAVAGLLLGVIASTAPRKYQADATIRIEPGLSSMYRTSPMAVVTGEASDKIASETQILQNRSLFLQVARELELVNDPNFSGRNSHGRRSLNDPATRESVIRLMHSRIKITHNSKDEIVNLACTTTSPALSTKILNTLINDYIEYIYRMKYGANQRTASWLISQLSDLKKEIEDDQKVLTDLQGKLGIIGRGENESENLSVASLDATTKAAGEATIQRILAEAKYRYLSESDPSLIETESQPLQVHESGQALSLLQTLRVSQSQQASNYARLSAQFGPNYPEVKQAKAQLDAISLQVANEEKRIVNQSKLAYQAASANEQMVTSELSKQKNDELKSHDDLVRYIILLHDYESHRSLYEGLVQRLREASITSGMESGEVDIVDLADIPGIPNPPGPLTLWFAGLCGGIFTGALLALAIELGKSRIINTDQAEALTGLPVLASLPHFLMHPRTSASAATEAIVQIEVLAHPNSRYTEAIHSLQSATMISLPGRVPKILLVTSSVPNEGKTTVAQNLAAALAQNKRKVLLVDCDLRRGSLSAGILRRSGAPGLSQVLTSGASYRDALVPIAGSDTLWLLPSGPLPPQPAVLLDSAELKQFLEEVSGSFEHIVLDCPPLLGFADAANLGRHADAMMIVIRQDTTHRKELREALMVLRAARLAPIGIVFNDASVLTDRYGYGGSYYKYYQREEES